MKNTEMADYNTVLEVVRAWPAATRINLLHDVLRTLSPADEKPQEGRSTLSKALGLLATGGTSPSDQEVEQWLEERRIEKCS